MWGYGSLSTLHREFFIVVPQIVLLFLSELEKRRAHACSSATKMDIHVQNGWRSIKWFEELSWIFFVELIWPTWDFLGRWHLPSFGAGLCSSDSSASWGYELSKEYHVLALQSDEELITDALRSYLEGRSILFVFCKLNALGQPNGLLQLLPGTSYMFFLHRQGCRPNSPS